LLTKPTNVLSKESDTVKKFLVILAVLLFAAVATVGQSNPYATPDNVDRFNEYTSALYPILAGTATRATTIQSTELPLLQALVNNNFSKMTALFFQLPVKSWAHLFSIMYVSKTSTTGSPRRILSLGDALLWLTVYDLPLGDTGHPAILDGDGVAIFPWLSL